MRVRGARNCRLSIGDLANDESVQPLFLYPSSNAILLCEKTVKQFKKPIHLIVPDGTWSQVRRLIYREQELSKIPYVTICTRPSRYRLRASPTVGALSTYEAVAAALQVIEGAHAYSQLNSLFEEFVTRTLTTRTPARRGTCTVFSEST